MAGRRLGSCATAVAVTLAGLLVAPGPASSAAAPPAAPASAIMVNQVGYLPGGPKQATLVTPATDAVPWELVDAAGRVVARGSSRPTGVDPTSGFNVHEIDVGSFTTGGRDYTLTSDGQTSHAFDISASAYERLRIDSLSFFYPQRSGTPIDGSIAGDAYAREPGHLGISPNLGDVAVPCQTAAAARPVYGEPWTCAYTLDVSGGWYDAGDHGKYVVNGGIAVHQLLSAWERSTTAATADRGAIGDGTLRIPERDNGRPDVLDEARWELEWMLRMQVPAGQPLAGMVHHKVHDRQWTSAPLLPASSPAPRELHRPSTAATLNLAAVAAQGARLYGDHDAAFAARLLSSARTAWDAAVARPALLAPVADDVGGGPYADDDVADEFYWAATELFLTTGEQRYADAVVGNPLHVAEVFETAGFYWGYVAPLARLDLATVPNRLADRERMQRSVLEAADAIVALQEAEPWGQAYAPETGSWEWGSNSLILNNLIVLATAYDLSRQTAYRNAVLESMDYLLGRNANDISYVTGYGERFAHNQTSLWYANQLDPRLPNPPPGAVAGGPNSGLQDPVARDLLEGCAPQRCYVDDIGSWSTNEIAINWNSALAWIASFVADQDDARRRAATPYWNRPA
jgi:endoglucanase